MVKTGLVLYICERPYAVNDRVFFIHHIYHFRMKTECSLLVDISDFLDEDGYRQRTLECTER